MATTRPIKKAGRRRVTFLYQAPDADEVILMGDFNNWNSKKHPMKKDAEGTWKKIVMLWPGGWEYKFLVDGKWRLDPANDRICPNCYGTKNNMVFVEKK